MSKVLLINPSYYLEIYGRSKIRAAISRGTITLGLLCLAASLREAGHSVQLLDLNIVDDPYEHLNRTLRSFRPEYAGITATTPLIKKAYQIAEIIKKHNDRILVIAGGPHPSALPEQVLRESRIDAVVCGEGDLIFPRILAEGLSPNISNLYYKDRGAILAAAKQGAYVPDLDILPFPAYDLLDIKKYEQPGIASKRNPVGYYETSRGCYARCIYCNKNIFGTKIRMKSVTRVVDDMERMLQIGFREIQIIDDIFTADMKRAYAVCEEILRRKLKLSWYPRGGIRVDRVSLELLQMMKKAGCYRIPFGIESGSQRIIDVIQKRITLEQAEKAVGWAKKAGLETECYFMIGLPTETAEDIESSIAFAIKLDPDYAKFALTIPLPGTPMFESMQQRGQIKTTDWDKYNFSVSPKELYDHDVLSWNILEKYSIIAYRRFYFRPRYALKMLFKTMLNGTFLDHFKAFFRTQW